ncbi:MAG: hypothetical protein A2937_02730 [Candidatus Yonathbacteria bacterium RIFCSPLOWO2_01_FULL_47_33b]|uniref:Uncharacterized protein n=1 Tax=Candidatus Yonathbacteria bacterium RIFCSPLOWO2_01_FULL_47_33b TaxID=1802727 RepID=A0A1G2SGD8_9BACT|nr:MAG: hypothetical protein A2937_02730 [Candidatus Yonathbacteria bacterium RIFCSPLOWO2_01_FULL_47_33b]
MMSNRWSLIKRFGPITHKDFMLIGGNFCHLVEYYHQRTSETIVTLYKELPYSVTAPEDGISEWVDEENSKKELAVIAGIQNVPRDLFDLAENVQVIVVPNLMDSSSNVCGYMECKGLLSRHMVFSVSPDLTGKYLRSLCLSKENRPSKLWFGQGDGFEKLHHYSLS